MDNLDLNMLPELLLPWYRENHRCLPWRETKEPYHIWLSEIMLQQTRVEAVKGYYARFLAALPTVEALANCDDDALHKLWEGLGYYSRVRNLKRPRRSFRSATTANFPGNMMRFWRCPVSASILRALSAPSPLTSPSRLWTAMCCGSSPG